MSRSRKGSKSVGFDYWGKRALSGSCGFGPDVKHLTHGMERARARQELHKEPREPEWDPREYSHCTDGYCAKCEENWG